MGYWRRHPKKEGQDVLDAFDRQRWRIENSPTYYTVLCACGDHQTRVHLTPSDPNYWRNKLAWARRQPCWNKEDER